MTPGTIPPAGMGKGRPPKVLVHLPNWLGDVIMTTPLLSFLDQAFAALDPPSDRPELHLAVRAAWAPLFQQDPRIKSLLPIDRRGCHAGVTGLWCLARQIKQGGFDAVLVGPPSLRAGLTAAVAGIPLRIGQVGDGRDWLLRPGLARSPRGSRHFAWEMLDLGLALLAELGISAPPLDNSCLPISSLPGCRDIPSLTFPAGQGPLWVVAPGTTYGQAKTWPQRQVREFMDLAITQHGARIVLLGDGQTREFVSALQQDSDLTWTNSAEQSGQVIDLVGRTDLIQAVSVLKGAAAFVGNDSGLMHLAGAVGVPAVGVFGSSNPAWTHPLGRATAAVTAQGFPCQPCYRKRCNQPQFCLATVSAADVLSRLVSLIEEAGTKIEGV